MQFSTTQTSELKEKYTTLASFFSYQFPLSNAQLDISCSGITTMWHWKQ